MQHFVRRVVHSVQFPPNLALDMINEYAVAFTPYLGYNPSCQGHLGILTTKALCRGDSVSVRSLLARMSIDVVRALLDYDGDTQVIEHSMEALTSYWIVSDLDNQRLLDKGVPEELLLWNYDRSPVTRMACTVQGPDPLRSYAASDIWEMSPLGIYKSSADLAPISDLLLTALGPDFPAWRVLLDLAESNQYIHLEALVKAATLHLRTSTTL
jgi:hypothetical protein